MTSNLLIEENILQSMSLENIMIKQGKYGAIIELRGEWQKKLSPVY